MAEAEPFTTFDGSEFSVVERPAGPSDRLVMRFRLPDGCGSPPPHVHPHGTETFEVEQGEIELLVEREWRLLRAGESLTVAVGQRHTFRNESGSTAIVLDTHDPHHDFERYLRIVAALTNEHRAMAPTSPAAAARFALLLKRHSDLIRVSDPPLRVATAILAPLARILGTSLPDPA